MLLLLLSQLGLWLAVAVALLSVGLLAYRATGGHSRRVQLMCIVISRRQTKLSLHGRAATS